MNVEGIVVQTFFFLVVLVSMCGRVLRLWKREMI